MKFICMIDCISPQLSSIDLFENTSDLLFHSDRFGLVWHERGRVLDIVVENLSVKILTFCQISE